MLIRLSTRVRRSAGLAFLLLVLLGSFGGCGTLNYFHPQARLQKEEEKEITVKTIGDVTEVDNASPTVVSGVGLVTGLEGTGGGAPPGMFKTMLETELHRRKVEHVRELLASDTTAVVLVTALIPAGAHKEDPLDVQITLPPGSHVKSLRGGYLQECDLFNYDTAKHLRPDYDGSNKLLKGWILAKAQGPLLVGFGDGDEAAKQKTARIWGGAVSLINRPFLLTLKTDHQFARIANAVAERINQTFRDDNHKRLLNDESRNRFSVLGQVTDRLGERFSGPDAVGNGTTAKAINREVVNVAVPWEYRLNPERYLRVARLIPLQESPEIHTVYRRRLQEKLLDPAQTISAALRLEALGKESIPALTAGLKSEHVLVRFCAAEALSYLGSAAGGQQLAQLVQQQPKLRAYCLTALASLNESVCHVKLCELLSSLSAETRYGAFRALYKMDERDPDLQGELLNDAFWVHRLAPQSPPLVHLACSRRAEICLFGEEPTLVPPFAIVAGEFTVTAGPSDDRCTVSCFPLRGQAAKRCQCSLKLHDVLHTLADLGAMYTDVAEVLTEAERLHSLTCHLKTDALPQAIPVEELAKHAQDPDYLSNGPEDERAEGADDSGSGPRGRDTLQATRSVREGREDQVPPEEPGDRVGRRLPRPPASQD